MARKIELARGLSSRLKLLAHNMRRAEAELSAGLLEMAETGLFRALGYACVEDFAEAELDLSAGKAKELVDLARRLRALPRTADAFRQGEIPWTKARQVARVATPDTETEWIAKAKALSSRGLEQTVAEAKGEEPRVRLAIDLSREDAADLMDAVRRLREERSEAIPLGAALAELARRAAAPDPETPACQVVLQECPTCKRASRDAATGPVPVSPEEVEAAKEEGEVLDLRAGPTGTRTVEIPPAVRRAVLARDRGRCRLCGGRGWLHLHHLVPRSRGGSSRDPENLIAACWRCHKRLIHGRHVTLRGPASALEATLADGIACPVRPPG